MHVMLKPLHGKAYWKFHHDSMQPSHSWSQLDITEQMKDDIRIIFYITKYAEKLQTWIARKKIAFTATAFAGI